MQEYGFSLTHILQYKDRIENSYYHLFYAMKFKVFLFSKNNCLLRNTPKTMTFVKYNLVN